jgi:hypothetical protein
VAWIELLVKRPEALLQTNIDMNRMPMDFQPPIVPQQKTIISRIDWQVDERVPVSIRRLPRLTLRPPPVGAAVAILSWYGGANLFFNSPVAKRMV